MSNIAVLIGSVRKNGNTDLLAHSFIDGAISAGNSVEIISVSDNKINGCVGCNCCYTNGNVCVQKDGMDKIYEKLAEADVIVIATPVYFYGVSSQLKAIIDRLHNPIRNGFKVKKLALLAVSADTIPTVYDSVKAMYYSTLKYFNLQDGGIVTAPGVQNKGDIKNSKSLQNAYELGKMI